MAQIAVIAGIAALQGTLAYKQAQQQSKAIKSQAKYQEQMANINSRMADIQSLEAIKRGETNAQDIKTQGRRVIGAQRAALAAQGINVDDGTALDIQLDTAQQVARDAVTVRNNAWREAWGYKVEAINQTASGQFVSASAKFRSSDTLMTGGMQALGYGIQGADRYGAFSSSGGSYRQPSGGAQQASYSDAFKARGSA